MHDAIIHIGTEKTGTSSLQRFLLANKPSLIDEGFLFPGREPGHHKIALRAWAGYGTEAALGQFDYQAYRDDFLRELSRHPSATVLLSTEFFHSRVQSPRDMAVLSSLIDDLGLQVRKIVVYFRDQASLAQAAYAEMVKANRKTRITAEEICADPYFDHHGIAALWSEQFGASALSIYSYNQHKNDITGHFCHAAGLDIDAPRLVRPGDVNRTPSPVVVEFLRQVNRTLELPPLEVYRKLLNADNYQRHSIFTDDELHTLSSWFGPRNARLCSTFGLNDTMFQPHYQDEPGRHPELDRATFRQLLQLLY